MEWRRVGSPLHVGTQKAGLLRKIEKGFTDIPETLSNSLSLYIYTLLNEGENACMYHVSYKIIFV